MSDNRKLPRREFLANLLFAGGMLSVTALKNEYGLVAHRSPKDDGWELPDDDEKNPTTTPDGWELPEDLLEPTRPPKPPKPEPPPNGGIRPPQIRGRMRPPQPLPGSVQAPKPD